MSAKRWLPKFAGAVGVTVAGAAILLWLLGYTDPGGCMTLWTSGEDGSSIDVRPAATLTVVVVSRGVVAVGHVTASDSGISPETLAARELIPDPSRKGWTRMNAVGFSATQATGAGYVAGGVSAPCWFIVLLATPFVGVWVETLWRKRRRWSRFWHGQCPDCGYSLQTSRAYCPECGRRVRHWTPAGFR